MAFVMDPILHPAYQSFPNIYTTGDLHAKDIGRARTKTALMRQAGGPAKMRARPIVAMATAIFPSKKSRSDCLRAARPGGLGPKRGYGGASSRVLKTDGGSMGAT